MNRWPVAIAPLLVVVALTACNDSGREQRRQSGTASAPSPVAAEPTAARAGPATPPRGPGGEPPSTQPLSFTGTLRGDAVAIGGETTGWRLEGDGQTGGIDVDVSGIRSRAEALEGQRVSVSGKMTTRSWPERGETQVLVVNRIEEAPPQNRAGAGAPAGGTGSR